MRLIAIILLLSSNLNPSFAQSVSYSVTFDEVFYGVVDTVTNQVIELRSDTLNTSSVTFNANTKTLMISEPGQQTIQFDLIGLDHVLGDDYVQYRFMTTDKKYFVFMRYNRYYIEGIIDLAIYQRGKYVYMTTTSTLKNTTAHEDED